ncbi:EthD family reductase [Croceitalea rosinachiae]|uniref:EthD family reductase n=1 Tax=Croceitalea rosinachiae TaxID=3075596 RepID=A0ABU3A8W4_9FLAO|nr:EthD family reductase [Croceitalea sp. F388]MDT0606333.1 EthD family reductase [Croceitalea sp. F388]
MRIPLLIYFILITSLGIAQRDSMGFERSGLPGWFKISILYPNREGQYFNMDYYSKTHMPMVAALFGDRLKGYSIDKGLSGRTSDDAVTYIAVGYFYFEKLSDYKEAFGPNADKIRGDIPNYTNIQPIVQISQIIK